MTINFENWISTSVGLDIGIDTIKVVELRKGFRQIKLLKFGMEPIEHQKSEVYGSLWAIQKLFEKLEIKNRNVALHVSGRGIRHMALESPPLSPQELDGWIKEQMIKRFPASINPSHLAISYHTIEQNERGYRLLVAYCQSHIIEEKLELVERANLCPVSIGGGSLDLIHAFIFETEKFFKQTLLFIYFGGSRTSCTITENGIPVFYQELDPYLGNKNNESELIRQLHGLMANWIGVGKEKINEILLVGEYITDEYPLCDSIQKSFHAISPVHIGSPLSGLLSQEKKLSSEYSLAAGLALKKYFPLLNGIDLLPETQKKEIIKQIEKKTAMTTILGLGGIIIFLMLLLNITTFALSKRLDHLEEEMVVFNDQLFSIELTKKEQSKLFTSLKEMQRLVARRSHWAELMEEMGRITPEKLWLYEIHSLQLKKEQKEFEQLNKLVISGYAFNEGKIAALIANLENSDFFEHIQLIQTDRLSADEVWEKTKSSKIPLIRFTVLTTLSEN